MYLDSYAKNHPYFSKEVCGRTANLYKSVELRARWMASHASGGVWTGRVAPLPASAARDLGADIIGETILFVMLASIIVNEVNRKVKNEKLREAEISNKWESLLIVLQETRQELNRQQVLIDSLREMLQELGADFTDYGPHSSTSPPSDSEETADTNPQDPQAEEESTPPPDVEIVEPKRPPQRKRMLPPRCIWD